MNLFGAILRAQMVDAKIKESQLAEALSYDTTYISKWLNGSKLPSARNAEKIMRQITDYFAAQTGKPQTEFLAELRQAYESDSRYLNFQAYSNHRMSFTDSRRMLYQLTRDALLQAVSRNEKTVSVTATFDLFRLYGSDFRFLIQELREAGAERVELRLALDPKEIQEDGSFYVSNILRTIGFLDYVEMTVTVCGEDGPQILVIDEVLCMQILWNFGSHLAVVFSMDQNMVLRFGQIALQMREGAAKLMDPAEPESLKRTNVQIESYSDHRQRLFFNEPPAMLFPDELMDAFIEGAENEDYAGYLARLKSTFLNRTCRSQVDLVMYASQLNQYLSDGRICVGNVSLQLTEEQVAAHLRYLSGIMQENREFAVYLIRDTVQLDEDLSCCPSIFIDTHSLYLENSKKRPNDNFHISMDERLRQAFSDFFDNMLQKSYCCRLTPEDMLRYL